MQHAELSLEDLCFDRRHDLRVTQKASVCCSHPDGGRLRSRTIELSQDGGRMLSWEPLNPGQVFHYTMQTENGSLRGGTARVVWSKPSGPGQSVVGFTFQAQNHRG